MKSRPAVGQMLAYAAMSTLCQCVWGHDLQCIFKRFEIDRYEVLRDFQVGNIHAERGSAFLSLSWNQKLIQSRPILPSLPSITLLRLTPASSSCSSPYLMATIANTDNELCSSVNITQSFPFELHYIKALYLNHQYKECARRCEELLAHNQVVPRTKSGFFISLTCIAECAGTCHLSQLLRCPFMWRSC